MANRHPFTEQEFENLFKEYFPFLCSFAKKYVDDEAACKDIIHNVFLNLWEKREELHHDTSLKSYLFKSVHNRCLNHIRDHKKIIRHDLLQNSQQVPDYIDSTDYLEQSELEMRIKKAIDSLPEKCRRIFLLSRFQEKKYVEIAQIEGVTVKAIEAQMSKALRLLREQLIDYLILLVFLSWIFLGF